MTGLPRSFSGTCRLDPTTGYGVGETNLELLEVPLNTYILEQGIIG